MNLLLDALPMEVVIDGETYEIDTDFRVSMQFELLVQSDLSAEDKLITALELYFGERIPSNIDEAVRKIVWFYGCGQEPKKKKKRPSSEKNTDAEENTDAEDDDEEYDDSMYRREIYSFEHDDAYIYGAFMTQYGIDLTDIEYMHWWKFRALFKCLKEDIELVKIMGYRSAKITNDMSKKEQEFLRKMKRIHALPLSESEQKYNDALTDALMNGGDVSKILSEG